MERDRWRHKAYSRRADVRNCSGPRHRLPRCVMVAPTGSATWWASTCGSPSRVLLSGLKRPGRPLTVEHLKRLHSDPCFPVSAIASSPYILGSLTTSVQHLPKYSLAISGSQPTSSSREVIGWDHSSSDAPKKRGSLRPALRRDPELVADELAAATVQDRRAPDPACAVLHPAVCRELLDRAALSADSRAHRATFVASDLIGNT